MSYEQLNEEKRSGIDYAEAKKLLASKLEELTSTLNAAEIAMRHARLVEGDIKTLAKVLWN